MRWLSDFGLDLKYGARGLRKAPLFTLFAALTLGLGIGANTTVFTIVDTLLLHPLPAGDASRLAALYDSAKGARQASAGLPLSYVNFKDYAARQECFRAMAAYTPPQVMTLRGDAGPERMFSEFVSARYFDALSLKPAAGRFFLASEASQPGSLPVAVLSYNAWQARFGGAANAIGRTLELNNVVFTVVGVAPRGFLGVSALFGPDVWLPATMCERAFPAEFRDALSERGKPLFHALGQLQQGFTRERAQADLDTIAAALAREYPDTNEGHAIRVRPISDELYFGAGGASGVVFGSVVLLAMVALVLGIACANAANLLMARAAARRREMAVRLAMGAGRGRLLRQLLAESLLLSLLGFAVGLGVGEAGRHFLWSFVPAEVVQNMLTPRLDATVLLYALALSLLTAILFGAAPALAASKADVSGGLQERAATAGRGSARFSKLLVAGQVAFSLVCLITSALVLRSFQRAYTIDAGFDSRQLSMLMMDPAQAGYGEARVKAFYKDARARVAALPGVASASWVSGMPFWNTPSRTIAIEGEVQSKNRRCCRRWSRPLTRIICKRWAYGWRKAAISARATTEHPGRWRW